MTGLRTFDVFDTVVTRRLGHPEAVFSVVGRRLRETGLLPCSVEVFARTRARAERVAAIRHGTVQPTLAQISIELARLLDLAPDVAGDLADVELAVEREVLVPVPGMREHLDALRRAGHEIAFVSDMYLPSSFLEEILDTLVLRTGDERVHVSAEVGLTKRNGDLYPHVLSAHGRRADETTHTGDDLRADIERARQHGIAAEHVRDASLNRFEATLEEHCWESGGRSSVLAGASRHARLHTLARTDHRRRIRDVAAGAAAPLLIGYVDWVLRRATALGIDHLHFLSRDGEVLLDIARRLLADRDDGPECSYLHGSRQAWYPAGADTTDPAAALAGIRHPTDDSVRVVLDRCGLDPGDWTDGTDGTDREASIDQQLQQLAARPGFLDAVATGIASRQERLLRYLDQQGLLDGRTHAVVDLGWSGRSLHSLGRLLEQHGHAVPTGFYLDLDASVPLRQPVEVWLTGVRRRLPYVMIETFCTGSHGQVTDYAIGEAGEVVPVLRAERNDAAYAWGLDTLRETIDRAVDGYLDAGHLVPDSPDVREAAVAAFEGFYRHPTPAEAEAWGAFPFELGAAAESTEHLAPPRGFVRRIRDRRRSTSPYRWHAGDRAQAPRALRALSGLRALVGRLRTGRRRRR